ncbi:Uncharacterised protein [Mycolicibacterium vanbaalenii]|uniref:Uncharacterized protein n=1 Tax=Mycolicibacterium vanbaalenii TaxID=110539 RepID=A0A5S9R7M0_MYCVN|nr:Uncharacterised protein [Mycolicibacterium vanbaalenii]
MVGDILDGRQLVVVRQQRRTAKLDEPAHLGGPLRVTVDAGETPRTIDDAAHQMVSGHLFGHRHSRLLHFLEVFDL